MPVFLLPLLKQYWKPLLVGGLVLVVGFYIWILRNELAACQGHVAMFEAVQKNNEAAIKAQNKAVQKLWVQSNVLKKQIKDTVQEARNIVSDAQKKANIPIVFTSKSTCDQDIDTFYKSIQEIQWAK